MNEKRFCGECEYFFPDYVAQRGKGECGLYLAVISSKRIDRRSSIQKANRESRCIYNLSVDEALPEVPDEIAAIINQRPELLFQEVSGSDISTEMLD